MILYLYIGIQFNKAMLKLTGSFCRYLKVTCKKGSNIHVNTFSYLSSHKKCTKVCSQSGTHHSVIQHGPPFHADTKECCIRLKKNISLNNIRKLEQMTDPLRPTLHHTSYGGDFEILSNEDHLKNYEGSSETRNEESSTTSSIPPDFRVWEPVHKKRNNASHKFTVVSYNVLAQFLLECHPYLYTECSPRDLKWKVRAAKLYDEILSLSPDIICLQEVQASHLNSFYSKFEQIGYFGIFKRKTGHRHDGCAIYFKQDLFDLQDQLTVEYYQPGMPILNRDNIGLMVKLIPRCSPTTPIVVATTHLLYNPKRTDVRLAQMQVLLAEIDRFAYYNNGMETGHHPIILTGDFNSTPDSAVIQLLDNGHVSCSSFRDNSDWMKIGVTDNCQHLTVYLNRPQGQCSDFCMTKIYNSEYSPCSLAEVREPTAEAYRQLFNSGVIGHFLPLTSVYSKVKPDGSAEATTFQDVGNWVTVDYIYFSNCSALKLLERLRLPTAAECKLLGKLPNEIYGSDHLALAAVFEINS